MSLICNISYFIKRIHPLLQWDFRSTISATSNPNSEKLLCYYQWFSIHLLGSFKPKTHFILTWCRATKKSKKTETIVLKILIAIWTCLMTYVWKNLNKINNDKCFNSYLEEIRLIQLAIQNSKQAITNLIQKRRWKEQPNKLINFMKKGTNILNISNNYIIINWRKKKTC